MIESMYKIKVLGLQKDKAKLLKFLHEKGCVHISEIEEIELEQNLQRDSSIEASGKMSETLLELKWMEETLRPFAKNKYIDPNPINYNLRNDLNRLKLLKRDIHKSLSDNINNYNENILNIGRLETQLNLLKSLPFKLNTEDIQQTKKTFTFVLNYEGADDFSAKTIFKEFLNEITLVQSGSHVLIQGLKNIIKKIEDKIIMNDLKILDLSFIEKDVLTDVKHQSNQLLKLKKENKEIVQRLKDIADNNYEVIVITQNNMSMFNERFDKVKSMLKTNETFFLEGFIPERNLECMKKINSKVHIECEAVEDAPIKLRNKKYCSRFEFVTKMFGLPQYKTLDPTPYISVFIPFFFGFMFSDVGYGLMLLFASIFLYASAKPINKIMKDAGIVLMTSAIMTILFGFLFGSFFGNLIKITPILFDPFKNAKLILVAALVIGLIHINLGIFLSIYLSLKVKNYKKILFDNVSILLLEVGGLFLAINNKPLGLILIAISVILLVIKNSLMGIMTITGFFGTWFSYARLLALCLATGGIALGVNIIASLFSSIYILGPVLFIIFIIVGHTMNFALNVLGSSVHSVRLQYIEFFSQFYTVGGKQFKNFTTKKINDSF